MASRSPRGPDAPARGGPDHGAAPRSSPARPTSDLSAGARAAPPPADAPRRPPRRGTSDPRATRARELHRKAADADEVAARYRLERDRLVLQLRAEDPARWSYSAIADALGCSPELVALVVRRSR